MFYLYFNILRNLPVSSPLLSIYCYSPMAYDIKSWYQNIFKDNKDHFRSIAQRRWHNALRTYAHKLGLYSSSTLYNWIVYASFRVNYCFALARDKMLILNITHHRCSNTKWPCLLSNIACWFYTSIWSYWHVIASSISGICRWAVHNDVINSVFQFHKAL